MGEIKKQQASAKHPGNGTQAPEWVPEPDGISLTLTANAGLLVDCGGEKLLVDGFNNPEGLPFSRVPEEILLELLQGTGRWKGIRWMAFTHLHPDHFSNRTLRRYLKQNRLQGLFLPLGGAEDETTAQTSLKDFLEKQTVPVEDLSLLGKEAVCFPLNDTMKLTAFRVSHAGEEHHQLDHICFLLEAKGKRVLFLGDAEYDGEPFQPLLSGLEIDAAVITPMFVCLPKGRNAVAALHAKRLIVDHLPFEQDDRLGLRKLTARCLERYGEKLPPATVLWDPLAQVKL